MPAACASAEKPYRRREPEQRLLHQVTAAAPQHLVLETGDLIVVHLSPPSGYLSETTSKSEHANALGPANHDDARNLRGGPNSMSATSNRILVVFTNEGFTQDAAAFVHSSDDASCPFAAHLQVIQQSRLWRPENCGGFTCDAFSALDRGASWQGVGSGYGVNHPWPSLIPGAKDDWSVTLSSFGAANP